MNWTLEEIATRPRQQFSRHVLQTINPKTESLPAFREVEEFEIAFDIHRRHATLDFQDGGSNPWGIRAHTLFPSTGGRELFLRREDLEEAGWRLNNERIFSCDGEQALPLIEGQLVNRYDHRARTYEGYAGTNKYGRKPNAPWTTSLQKRDPTFDIEPRYWVRAEIVGARVAHVLGGQDDVFVAFRDVVRPWREQRSAKAALIAFRPCTDKAPVFTVPRDRVFAFLALFNSTIFDFLARGHLPGASMKQWILSQVAAPQPPLDNRLSANSEHLSLTSMSVAILFDKQPYVWDENERYALDVETDALVALAYGLDLEQYGVVLDAFHVMRREQERRHGFYKFKEDCLAAFAQENDE